ncbi:MAG: chemotaxis protein CheA, partial [Burkholderiaceae bacterium]
MALLLACGDHMRALVDGVAAGEQGGTPELAQAGEPLVADLRAYLTGSPAPASHVVVAGAPVEADPVRRIDGTQVDADHWHISVRFGPDVLRNGMDPLSFIRYLGTLGQITAIATVADALPDVAVMDPETCYLGFEIAFKGNVDKAAIEQVFEFVRDDSQLFILPPHSLVSEYVKLLDQQQGDAVRLGEMLVRCGTLSRQELDTALNEQVATPSTPIGTILVTQGSVQPEVVEAALQKQKQTKETVVAESRSIRVDADKLDQLINLVGELIIAGANVNMIAHRAKVVELDESTSKLSTLVEEVRALARAGRTDVLAEITARVEAIVRGPEVQLLAAKGDLRLAALEALTAELPGDARERILAALASNALAVPLVELDPSALLHAKSQPPMNHQLIFLT